MTASGDLDVKARYGGWGLVAGAACGLGAAVAREAARLGFDVGLLARRAAAIAIVSSLAALQGARYLTIYAASKAYELILAEGLWEELGDWGVDALAYVVGATVSTSWIGAAPAAYTDAEELSALQARILQPATAEDVAARLFAVLHLGPPQHSHLAAAPPPQEPTTTPRPDRLHA